MTEYTAMIEKFKSIGIPDDAATWLADWCPEAECYVDAGYEDMYSPYVFRVMTEDEFAEHLEWHDVDEDEYNYKYGITFWDAAFEGVIVIGE